MNKDYSQLAYGLTYSSILSIMTPPLVGFNLSTLYQINYQHIPWVHGSLKMFVPQIALRSGQLLIASQIKEQTNPWIGFGCIGLMQGVIYGHANTSWLKYIKLPVKTSPNIFRGALYAISRDTISQGVPYAFREYGLGPVIGISIISTISSQVFHNCQTIMQVKSYLSYRQAFFKGWDRHGYKLFYHGFQSRIALMLGINILNYLFLDKIWSNQRK